MSNPLKRTVSVLTSVATIMSFSGFAALAPMLASAAVPADYGLHEGDTISASNTNDPDVYIVNEFGYKRLFLNPIIFSFYGHLGGFANVKSVSAPTRDAFPSSGLYRNCESNAQAVWAVEITGEDTGVLHHVAMSGDQAVAQDSQFFKKVFCINNNEEAWYPKSSVDYTSLSQIPVYSRVPGSTPTPTPFPNGPISVSLASDNPASGTLVSGQASADLAHFMFTGNGTVTSLKLNRIGVSADADLANVYLYDGIKRLTDAATVSNSQITFNDTSATGLFQVNGSRNISVRADLSTNSGETVGVQLVQVNGNAVNVSGNIFTVASAQLATVSLSATNSVSANTALDPSSDVNVWQNTATVGTRFVWLKSVQMRVIGSVNVGDLRNFRLYVDGVQQGAAVTQTDANGYVVFDTSASPVKLETGGRVIKVLADVVGGSSRNFTVSIRQAADFFTVDSQYNQPVLATAVGGFPSSAGQQTITSGTLTFTKQNDSPSGDIVKGASSAVLGRWQVKANGEMMKVESLRANFTDSLSCTPPGTATVCSLRNGAIFLDGVQIGSTQTLNEDSNTTTSTLYTFGSSFVVTPGQPRILELRADIFDNDGTDSTAINQTVIGNIIANTTNVQRLTTLSYIDCLGGTGCSAVSSGIANVLTIKTGSFTVSKFSGYANQSFVSPTTNAKVGHFTLTALSSEAINVNTITIDSDAAGTFLASDLSDMYIKVWNDTGSLIYTSPTKSTVSATASNSFSVNFTIPVNKTYQVEVFANIAAGETSGQALSLDLDASGVTANSSTTANATAAIGQTITINAGSLTVANGSLQPARLANGGSTQNAYAFTLAPAFDNFTLDEVYIDMPTPLTASQSGAVANLLLKDINGILIATATLNTTTGSASFTGLNRALSQSSGTQTFKVDVQLANVGVGANDTYGSVVIRLDGLKYRNSAGAVTTSTGFVPANFTGNAIIDVAGYPVFTNQALGTTVLSTGSKDIFQTNVSSVGTGAALKRVIFSVSTPQSGVTIGTVGANNLTNGTYKIFKDGVDITSFGVVATGSADLKVAAANNGAVSFTFTNDEALDAVGHVYKLQVNVTATGATPKSIITQITNNSTIASAPEDTANTTLMPVVPLVTSPSVVWTDSSAVAHSSATDDWMNDYLIKTINVSQSVSF